MSQDLCNALAPICGDRCTRPKGHDEPNYHQQTSKTYGNTGWFGDHSDDPGARESEARCRHVPSNSTKHEDGTP